ncbi:MAG: hypothetical protein WDO16_23535 [Bacteroidota bacterium]
MKYPARRLFSILFLKNKQSPLHLTGAQKNDTKEILSEVKTVKGKKAVTIQKTDCSICNNKHFHW